MTEVIKLKDVLKLVDDTDEVTVSVSKTENAEDGSRIVRTRNICRWVTKDECFRTLSEEDYNMVVIRVYYNILFKVYTITLEEI